jgi:hypothetical protein
MERSRWQRFQVSAGTRLWAWRTSGSPGPGTWRPRRPRRSRSGWTWAWRSWTGVAQPGSSTLHRSREAVGIYAASVIVPALNEAGAIDQVIRDRVERHPQYAILVIDDGSTDDTAELAALAGDRVIRHEWNKGCGASLKTGRRYARGNIDASFSRRLCSHSAESRDRRKHASFNRRFEESLLSQPLRAGPRPC